MFFSQKNCLKCLKLNPGLQDVKRECYLFAMQPPQFMKGLSRRAAHSYLLSFSPSLIFPSLGLSNGARPKQRNSPDPSGSRGPVRPPPPVPPAGSETEATSRGGHRMKWGSRSDSLETPGPQKLPPLPKNLVKNSTNSSPTPPLVMTSSQSKHILGLYISSFSYLGLAGWC